MITDGLILSFILSGVLLCVGARMKSRAVILISSLGWVVCGLQTYQQTSEVLPMGLLMMLAFSQFFILERGGN